jgi:hypothetical protein
VEQPDSPLFKGLQFAHLGNVPGGAAYRDESPYARHGTLNGFTGAGDKPGDAVGWDAVLKRPVLAFGSSSDFVSTPYVPSTGAGNFTVCLWAKPISGTTPIVAAWGSQSSLQAVGFRWDDTTQQLQYLLYGVSTVNLAFSGDKLYHHILASYDGTGHGWGDSIQQGNLSGTLAIPANSTLRINGYPSGTSFAGVLRVADVMGWDRALPASYAQALGDRALSIDLRLSSSGAPLILPVRRLFAVGSSLTSVATWVLQQPVVGSGIY